MPARCAKGHYKPLKKKTFNSGRKREIRPKTFVSKTAADVYAKKHGLKNYTLENLKSPESKAQKIRIKVEN
ncbi:hypothetical protein HN695_03755 [Candidatus Woesearchaeota archaeon]|jgi:hypothetical protein|nr:hypothetical protein [Candidatus Woesearchaeota archaeon]MBT5272264.1 hypothetical protein [Candidatus Woesearchaeota archaeon]MBT6041143.1 hypothetical protein [Candidatus Woesearchaeota archaeon]MBT6336536.1 hypothetical protein [Candidatus Woesearchaeota archaeon]MBT7927426.1 hypothetical protein [Candidatus Woesearchaeota archaeon]